MITKPVVGKIAIGILSVGGLGVAGYQGYQILNKEETPKIEKILNSKKLKEEKFVLLSEDDSKNTEWNAILSSYKQADSNLKFTGFDGNGAMPSALVTLKQKCKEALESEDSELLKKARKWCVTPVKASHLLTSRGSKVLKTEINNTNEEVDEWKRRIAAFEGTKKTKPALASLITLESGTGKETENIKKMKTECKKFGDFVSHAKDFEKNLENLGEWCVDKP